VIKHCDPHVGGIHVCEQRRFRKIEKKILPVLEGHNERESLSLEQHFADRRGDAPRGEGF
jgi:hypothetical protein